MSVYLFSDVFTQFKAFFQVFSYKDTWFLYDCAFGFMPRRFEDTAEDEIIYQEEDEVPEMYFFTQGVIGVGFSLIRNGLNSESIFISKKLYCGPQFQTIICDHYVVNNFKSQFIYKALKETQGYTLTKKFLNTKLFPKYPHI